MDATTRTRHAVATTNAGDDRVIGRLAQPDLHADLPADGGRSDLASLGRWIGYQSAHPFIYAAAGLACAFLTALRIDRSDARKSAPMSPPVPPEPEPALELSPHDWQRLPAKPPQPGRAQDR